MSAPANRRIYFTKLVIENIKAFAYRQELDLSPGGSPAQWTLIVGENGVGKTTLLQCLAYLRPTFSQEGKIEIEAAMSQEENEVIKNLLRMTEASKHHLRLEFSIGSALGNRVRSRRFATQVTVGTSRGRIARMDFARKRIPGFKEPLVIGYGAARHMGKSNVEDTDEYHPITSLFDSEIELLDAEDILYRLDYATLRKVANSSRLLESLKQALATILPDVQSPDNIEIPPPRLKRQSPQIGIFVRTPYGRVPFSQLSLGYQTVSAWTIDLAWRLFQHYPESRNPLQEPAIVLVDEIDLHLHPQWQRRLRTTLSEHFPNVQFVATAHSPLMAQTYLDANLAVVRREKDKDHAIIVNDPVVVQGWRLDQVITSELFGLQSARAPAIESQLSRRRELVAKIKLSRDEKRELQRLDAAIVSLPTEDNLADEKSLEIIRRAAAKLSTGLK